MTSLAYPYAHGDLLEARHTYFYSKYEGQAFLAAWQRQRQAIGQGPAAAAVAPENSATDRLLAGLHRQLVNGVPDPATRQTLNRLIQRFEVSKRLHGAYNTAWRPVDPADYRHLERYLRFAEVLDLAYARTAALPCLNTLLKCMDTLSAAATHLDADQLQRLQAVVAHEREHVAQLAQRLGVPYAS